MLMYTAPKRRAGVGVSFRVHKPCPRSRTSPGPQIRDARYKRFAELARVVALAPRALLEEFEPDAMAAGESDDESVDDDGLPAYLTPEGIWSALADELDSDDESGCAQMLRFAAKLDSFGIPLFED